MPEKDIRNFYPPSRKNDIFVILIIIAVFSSFLFWANLTHLDLVTKGDGRVVAASQNKNIQSPENGSIALFLVEVGSAVTRGDIIASINPIEAKGLLEELESRLKNLKLRSTRLEAELRGEALSSVKRSLENIDPLISMVEVDLMASRRENLKSKKDALNQELLKTDQELSTIVAEISGLKKTRDIIRSEKLEIMPLVDAGIVGNSERFRLLREESNVETNLAVSERGMEKANLTLQQIEMQIDGLNKQFLEDIYQERATVLGQIAELKARLPSLKKRLSDTKILSPVDGVVNRVFYNTKGAVVSAGEILAEIVPSGESTIIEAYIDPSGIATVEPGQRVRISLTAYDPTKYGYLYGSLTKVSADSVYREEIRSSSFEVNVSVDSFIYEDDGSVVPILPGMVAQIEIIRGDRTVLEYFWQPIAKIKDSAFRE